ncbi:hypothetical protein J6590_027388 [Homalodisca vitripennis]|nr:hypothetical protein J6590_027388 [Homalodisca vitripennis]
MMFSWKKMNPPSSLVYYTLIGDRVDMGLSYRKRLLKGCFRVVCNERLVRNLAASESRVLKKFGPYVLVAQRNCHSSWRKIYELSSWKKPTTKAVIASFPFMGSDRIFLKSCRCPSVCAITLDKRVIKPWNL